MARILVCLTELFAESPDAERDQHDGEEEQAEEVRPDIHESASLEHGSADDGGEVVDRIEDGERLQPLRHGLDGIERTGQGGERRIDEEAGELRLLRGFAEGGDDRADADAGKNAQAAGDEQQQEGCRGTELRRRTLMTAMAASIISESSRKSGAILAMMISVVLAGDMSNCSMVPASRSRTMAAEATMELLRMSSRPRTPVTMNQESTRPGLKRNAGWSWTWPRAGEVRLRGWAERGCGFPAAPGRRCSSG